MEKRLPIEDRFTLPEGRKACRVEDFQVSTKEYERLRDLEERYPDLASASVDPDELKGNIAVVHILGDVGEALKKIKVKKEQGSKAAKASSLREHDVVKGSQERIERIGQWIIDKIIVDFQKNYDVNDFFTGQFPSKDFPLSLDITTPSVGWVDDDGRVPEERSQDRRENFLYELERFVEKKVYNTMRMLLQFRFNGESIWDNWKIGVNLRKQHGTEPKGVIAEVFFTQIEKEK